MTAIMRALSSSLVGASLVSPSVGASLSAALLHFLWQGLVVAILFWLALFLLRKRSAALRYAVGCAALALLVLMPVITTMYLYERPAAALESVVVGQGHTLPTQRMAPPQMSFDWLVVVQAWAVPVWSFGVLLFSIRMAWGGPQIAALGR